MAVDIILIILGLILMIAGIAGCIIPVLPGVPFSYVGILFLHFTSRVEFPFEFLVGWAAIVVLVQILDYYVPVWGTKKFGGGKKGAWGCTIGIILGLFILPPWGIIIFPFLGAVVGELIDEKDSKVAIKAGFGAFIGFLAGIVMKLAVAIALCLYFVKEVLDAYILT
ncbi:DUF456 domain-containing protein [Dysgonomonas sp. 511]|uniref:DUF456 domain-containing protein n=1 Tax=Dysgonomonas sp. 511 TaxID=2302930 RepID=UPI0013D03D3A|nr:DUF456 domain-containing protein [Dysgonomonas sp. 511]NDV79925.1 DUF456 domain-containing protein [Dysgonomonas sp. 511]